MYMVHITCLASLLPLWKYAAYVMHSLWFMCLSVGDHSYLSLLFFSLILSLCHATLCLQSVCHWASSYPSPGNVRICLGHLSYISFNVFLRLKY